MGVALLLGAAGIACLFASSGRQARAQAPGLPFTEDFSTDTLKDGAKTTANWSTAEQKVYLAWRKTQYGSFGASTVGSDIDAADLDSTRGIALGDVDGDGDLDIVAGNYNQANRLYLNTGAGTFAAGTDITVDADATMAIALGDVDGDGDLDVVVGNWGLANRLYLNNGTATPFSGVTAADIAADADQTVGIAVADVDGDGDLDLVAGNWGSANRLYLNNSDGTFAAGADVTADAHLTNAVALGDMDGDGDLDLVAGNTAGGGRGQQAVPEQRHGRPLQRRHGDRYHRGRGTDVCHRAR